MKFASRKKLFAVSVMAATTVAAFSGTAGANRDAAAKDDGSPVEAAVNAYLSAYPGLSESEARAAAAKQDERRKVYDAALENSREFGGAWFEPTTGVAHIAVTNPAAAQKAEALGRASGLKVQTHLVRRSLEDLERRADALRRGSDELSQAGRGKVGLDVKSNKVVVAVPASERARLEQKGLPEAVALVDETNAQSEEDYGCTTRDACDYTIRAGVVIWHTSSTNPYCSAGFTARDANAQRYLYTAGHCSTGNGVKWGTGPTEIGTMQNATNSGAVDAAIIKVTNSWFTSDAGGEIYWIGNTERSAPVKGVATSLGYIVAGETVCLSANITDPGASNPCGVVGTNSDANGRGMVRVDGLDACRGDSGGGWYWLSSSGNRYAYGLHSNSDFGCHGDSGGSKSWFSAMPTVKSTFTPTLNVETR